MPCTDTTEVIRLQLDASDRIASYSLTKRSCGAAVGEPSLLAFHLVGQHAERVLQMTPADVDSAAANASGAPHDTVGARWQPFLRHKHLFAVQEALRVLLGHAAGTPGQRCSVVTVTAEHAETRFVGLISIDAPSPGSTSQGRPEGRGSALEGACTPPSNQGGGEEGS